jgi:hypothetical protein
MHRRLPLFLCLLIAAASVTGLGAHHAFISEFDPDKPVTLKGTVVKMAWTNPHAWIYVEIKGKEGKPEVWMIETGAPNALLRRGFTKHSLPPGTAITVEGHQARDGALRANGWELTLADGRSLFLGSSGTGNPYEKRQKGDQ